VQGDEQRLARALELGYAYLNRRDRTVSEVQRHLDGKGVASDLVDATIQALGDQGYLDDVRFAQLFVADKRELERWGNERIKNRLLARGMERELVEAALHHPQPNVGVTADTELDRALVVLRRRFPGAPRDRRDRERALGVLVRKGYDGELALDALAAYARGD
jgi:regulatory protein